MFDASQAADLSQAFDQKAQYQKMHDDHISTIESCIRSNATVGGTLFRWVPCISKTVPQTVLDLITVTLTDAGYTVNIDHTGIWNISWGVTK